MHAAARLPRPRTGRALADQVVAAPGPGVQRRAGHRQHLAALLGGQPRGDQRARLQLRLDHHHGQRQAGDQPVAAREVAGLGLGAGRALGDDAALLGDLAIEAGVLGRIDVVDAAAQHRHRAGGQRALVGRRVDAARQARDDRPSPPRRGRGRGRGRSAGRRPRRSRAPTMATAAAAQQGGVAPRPDQRRRRIERGQQGGKVRLARRDQPRAQRPPAASSRSASAWLGTQSAARGRRAGPVRAAPPAPSPASP